MGLFSRGKDPLAAFGKGDYERFSHSDVLEVTAQLPDARMDPSQVPALRQAIADTVPALVAVNPYAARYYAHSIMDYHTPEDARQGMLEAVDDAWPKDKRDELKLSNSAHSLFFRKEGWQTTSLSTEGGIGLGHIYTKGDRAFAWSPSGEMSVEAFVADCSPERKTDCIACLDRRIASLGDDQASRQLAGQLSKVRGTFDAQEAGTSPWAKLNAQIRAEAAAAAPAPAAAPVAAQRFNA